MLGLLLTHKMTDCLIKSTGFEIYTLKFPIFNLFYYFLSEIKQNSNTLGNFISQLKLTS